MRVENYSAELDRSLGYLWLWRLRWVGALSLLLGAGASHFLLQLRLPWPVIGLILGLLVGSNLLARPELAYVQQRSKGCALALLTLDLFLITLLLYFTGGAHNPFTILYLLLVVLAVILLPSFAAWCLVGLTVLAFGFLFLSPHMLVNQAGDILCHDMDFHLRGMVLGLGVAGAGVVYFVSSLTRVLREKHLELEDLRKTMAEQRKLVEMSAVVATVAHEVATPLGTIAVIGRDLESIDCASPCGNQLRDDARLIQESVARCRQVLQWVSERAAGALPAETRAVTASLFHDQLFAFLSREECARLDVELRPESPHVFRLPLQELVIATAMLIRNGLDASDVDGRVRLRWENDAHQLRIVITDTGHGMNEAMLAKIKEPFFTTKSPEQGFGLGLYLVNAFCERQKGALQIESSPEKGTVTTLLLPIEG